MRIGAKVGHTLAEQRPHLIYPTYMAHTTDVRLAERAFPYLKDKYLVATAVGLDRIDRLGWSLDGVEYDALGWWPRQGESVNRAAWTASNWGKELVVFLPHLALLERAEHTLSRPLVARPGLRATWEILKTKWVVRNRVWFRIHPNPGYLPYLKLARPYGVIVRGNTAHILKFMEGVYGIPGQDRN